MALHTVDRPAANPVITLYDDLLRAWNTRNAAAFARCFRPDGQVVGFDGSQMENAEEIAATLAQIFADHPTGSYVGKVRGVHALGESAMLLRAVVGMRPAGQIELRPELNAIQSLVAVAQDGAWRAALFQTTPAQFHGRPELVAALTAELSTLTPLT